MANLNIGNRIVRLQENTRFGKNFSDADGLYELADSLNKMITTQMERLPRKTNSNAVTPEVLYNTPGMRV